MRYRVGWVCGYSSKFMVREVDADSASKAMQKIRDMYDADFEHKFVNVKNLTVDKMEEEI